MLKKIINVSIILFTFVLASCNAGPNGETLTPEENPALDPAPSATVEVEVNNEETEAPDQQELTEDTTELPYDVVYDEQFEIWDPCTEVLSNEMLEQIGAASFTGSDEEIAQQIYNWQEENMAYVGDPGLQMDVSYQGRWNMFLPGIFPASELLVEHVNEDGKVYGICSDYTIIFCAIANSYGLETRNNTFTNYKFSDANSWVDPETTRGLAQEEYDALNEKLINHGVALTYDQIDRVAREGYVHQRPEVKIDGEWVSFDGAGIAPTGDYLNEENYEVLPFDADYNNVMLYAPPAMENGKLNLENLAELLSHSPQLDYEGITDDAGNEHRAAKFNDLCRGLGLVPYFEDPYRVLEFLNIETDNPEDVLEDAPEIMQGYEEGTGKLFYALADFLIFENDIEAAEYVYLYNAITHSDLTVEEFSEYMQ